MRFLYYDAKGTDGTNLAQMDAVYSYNGQIVHIPANAADPQAAVFQKLGLDPTAQTTRLTTLSAERTADAANPLSANEIATAASIADVNTILGQVFVRLNRLSDEIVDLRTGQS